MSISNIFSTSHVKTNATLYSSVGRQELKLHSKIAHSLDLHMTYDLLFFFVRTISYHKWLVYIKLYNLLTILILHHTSYIIFHILYIIYIIYHTFAICHRLFTFEIIIWKSELWANVTHIGTRDGTCTYCNIEYHRFEVVLTSPI